MKLPDTKNGMVTFSKNQAWPLLFIAEHILLLPTSLILIKVELLNFIIESLFRKYCWFY